ncbi:MAG: efflux transporter outer membrane subunit [Planctomycetes bacterium]|nr:efflux transporter outer membrane subunit [Planctomycetota bacterium]
MRRILPLLALAACKAGVDYRAPEAAPRAEWSESTTVATPAEPIEAWWSTFQDPALDALVKAALAQNLDLELARARILEARAVRDAVAGGDDPRLDASAGYARTRRSANEGPSFGSREDDLFRAGFDARWELDLFGRIDAQVQAAQAGVEAAVEARRDVAVTLLGDLARAYVELRGAQRELAVARANLASQKDTLALTRGRFQAGLASDLDVARGESQVATTESALPALDAAQRVNVHKIGVLLGRDPGAFANELLLEARVPAAPAVIAAGLPADLLRRRADVRRAERELARECALSNAARAELYPRLSLAGSWGQRSTDGFELLDSGSNGWSLGASLVLPIFEAGVLKANVRAQEARQLQALVRWQKTVLQAQSEVEDALVNLARERERNTSLANALASQQRAVQLASDLFTKGLVDFFQVLDAQRAQFVIELELARSSTRAVANAVALYKALGGGWSVADQSEPVETANSEHPNARDD